MTGNVKTLREITCSASAAYPDDYINDFIDLDTGKLHDASNHRGDSVAAFIAASIVSACEDAALNREDLGEGWAAEDLDHNTDPVAMLLDVLLTTVEEIEGVIGALERLQTQE